MSITQRCDAEDCGSLPHNNKSLGYCTKHWARYKKYGDATFTKYTGIRQENHPLAATWSGMKQRCYNSNHMGYSYYGGRGIKVCERWLESFQNFVDDVGNKPSKFHTLDRINPDGDYTPENCRWTTPDVQATNTNRKSANPIGVYMKDNGRWVAKMKRKKKLIYIGTYDTAEEATLQRELAVQNYAY